MRKNFELDPFNVELGKEIRTLRESKNWSLKEMGKRLGVTDVTVLYWEQGKNAMTAASLKKVCDMFNLSLAEFFSKLDSH